MSKNRLPADDSPQHPWLLARQQSLHLLAELLHVQPAAVLKLEKRADMYLATLRNHVEALGGTLEVVVKFGGEELRLQGFSESSTQD